MREDLGTAEVARLAGISKRTLLRWLYDGKLPEPKRLQIGGVDARVWSEKDLPAVKALVLASPKIQARKERKEKP
jgi:predicted DNA-binding transcriptional regulator AlpA